MALKRIRGLYIALHERTSASPTAFSATTDDEDLVLDDATSYPVCTIFEHRPSISVLGLPLDESYPDTTGHTPPAIPRPDLKIPALSHALLSHILSPFHALPMPSPWNTDTPSRFTEIMPLSPLELADPGPPILKFNGFGEFSGLFCHSLHAVLYRDKLYPTALNLFEARKFLDHRPDLADRIRECEHVEDVTSISAELEEFTRRDWGNVALDTVSKPFFHASRVSRGCLFHG